MKLLDSFKQFFGKPKREEPEKGEPMDYQTLFKALEKNEIRIAYEKATEPLPLGASKIGGKPHLPKGFEWCYFEGESYDGEWDNRPLAFLMQINLADVKDYDTEHLLPEKGMLYFFYDLISQCWGFDPSDKGCARVFYYDINATDLVETDFPAFPENESDYMSHDFPECKLTFSAEQSVPSCEEFRMLAGLGYKDFDWDAYEEAVRALGCDPEIEESTKLLGWANLIQGVISTECEKIARGLDCGHGPLALSDEEKADIREKAGEWLLLCQIDTITTDEAEWMWGDCGYLYFYIRKEDLKNRNFDDIWLVLQCG